MPIPRQHTKGESIVDDTVLYERTAREVSLVEQLLEGECHRLESVLIDDGNTIFISFVNSLKAGKKVRKPRNQRRITM